ncbi:pyruvate kinase [Mycoplasmopsis californica]|uniref:Pyruvate kinase n=1 Tax=Mycoplasmopsis equigenitalium TaxID=114883 RepID=A0ABY5J227_9BACT|nr:pyruvate kinase [Mycoplasmopsis equigenitalium]UUD37050.1 pyruvate kinase [Mycoplasmopsis equigenitalium]VEU69650.1 pyruvate kinase [Mycoplasmopsis californica]
MHLIDKRSKLIVTIGPSSDNYEVLRELIENGATAIRANFSHGDHSEQVNKFKLAQKISKDLHIPISIILDTKGPEIRVGEMLDGAQPISAKSKIKIWTSEDKYTKLKGTSKEFAVSYNMAQDLKKGDHVLLDDGKLDTVVTDVKKDHVVVEALNSHKLKTKKRINLPGVDFSLPFLAEKDINDVKFGLQHGITHVAASFVNSAANVNELRKLLNENGGEHVQIISKIESQLGITNIDEIIEASDAVMVARGDLGLEIPYYDVPYYQKIIVRKCRNKGVPVIVATQMLDSMENSTHATRAEVTDVYVATEQGADATMLSGESAQGNFPVVAVATMAAINRRAEKEFYNKLFYQENLREIKKTIHDRRSEIAYKIAEATKDGEYKFVVVLSHSGQTLKEVARFRPNSTIIGIVRNEKLIHSFGITSSVFVSLDSVKLMDKIKGQHNIAQEALLPYGPKKGDKFVVVDEDKFSFHVYK